MLQFACMVTKSSVPASATKTSVKKDFLIFISIPAGIILLVILILVVPSLFAKPGYDFMYSYCPSYDCSDSFIVASNGSLKEIKSPPNNYNYPIAQPAELYYHNTHQNSSRRIDFSEAGAYKLDSSNVSKDGYVLTQGGSSGGGFLFWGDYSTDGGWYLKKGSLVKSKPLNLSVPNYAGSNVVTLIGWVEK